jgi:hypothetical protein
VKLRDDVLRELLETSVDDPQDVRCHDHHEAENERSLERLLILGSRRFGTPVHRQLQNNGFCPEQLALRP